MEKGYLALVLHSHLPFIRHPESNKYLEERWLYEAITETYIPLLQVFQGLVHDGVDFHITLSLTPTLISMLNDELLQERYLEHINKLIELAEKETERTAKAPEFNGLAQEYLARFKDIRAFYLRYHCNLVKAFRELLELGFIEIITSAATHAFLPLVLTEEAIRAQIQTAVRFHEQNFGRKPAGIWLPECGFKPGLDKILVECGLKYFFVDSHGLGMAEPSPVFGLMAPVLTNYGVAAFARDEESSKQVWSAQEGYPGDYDYREYYRDIGYDLDLETIKPYIHPDGIRINTGIKYFRITGQGEHKEPYHIDWAQNKAAIHADNFLFNRQKQVEYWADHMGRKPIIVAPYDSELFGHWWYEGPIWIDQLFRKIHYDQDILKTITPTEYLKLYPDYQVCELSLSSWGRNGFCDVWLRGENDWIYPALHMAENRMLELADHYPCPQPLERRALNQAARELMLAQSSDWAFIMDSKTMVDYAVKRTKYHVNRFTHLYKMLTSGVIDEVWLSKLESLDNIFPDLDYRVYKPAYPMRPLELHPKSRSVLMLSWEFPPCTIGGLSRHVYDLSRFLGRQGWDVHVLTVECDGSPSHEVIEGVHVHRVPVLQPDGEEFIHWVLQLNLMMMDACESLIKSGMHFDLIHAHDWLVYYAAKALKERYEIPVVATIHATEYGRNSGIYTPLQKQIHNLEWKLTYEAKRVILCSQYMKREAIKIFNLPEDKLEVLPNGIDPELLSSTNYRFMGKEPYAREDERIILFIGRLVQEKGVQTLLEAGPEILAEFQNVKFVIAGQGPKMEELKRLSEKLGLGSKVLFTGFVADSERNRLLQLADVAVFPSLYEPFGIVALEAMAQGTPLVVSDVGGLTDIVEHEFSGLKMYPNDAFSLALQVKSLLRDPALAEKIRCHALDEVKTYEWSRIAEQTIQVYMKAINGSEKETICQIAVSAEE